MSIAEKFKQFCDNIRISDENNDKISSRYKEVTKRLNKDFRENDSEIYHSLYVGSYGRDTDVYVSDIDILFQLPVEKYYQYDNYQGNGQSALLQAVKQSIEKTYTYTHLKADGQVIVIPWTDGIVFEVVPCFLNKDGSYTFPNSNGGGSRRITNPKPEIEAIGNMNKACNNNLKNLCRMIRVRRDNVGLKMGGLLVDTLCYNFVKNWEYKDKSYLYYDYMVRDFFQYLSERDSDQEYRLAPGSGSKVYKNDNFVYKAKVAYNNVLQAINAEEKNYEYTANDNRKAVFGPKFKG